MSYMLTNGGFYSAVQPVEILALLLGGLCHDIAHPGTTNQYHIATCSELALRYNNMSVLENYHAAFTRRLLRRPENYIFDHMDKTQVRGFEDLLISVILATDMSTNFEHAAKFRRSMSSVGRRPSQFGSGSGRMPVNAGSPVDLATDAISMCGHRESFFLLAQMLIKCADVSHCTKPWKIHKRFAEMICEEFYAQGDLERAANLPISPYMDRTIATNVAKNQAGFFQFLVQPVWNAWMNLCPLPSADHNIASNIHHNNNACCGGPIYSCSIDARSLTSTGRRLAGLRPGRT